MSFFEIKDNIDSLLYRLFNAVSAFLFLFQIKTKRLVRKNKKLKDLHKGERCFILGSGPSLKNLTEAQKLLLNEEVTFGVNFLYKSEVTDIIRPTYYTLVDNIFFSSHVEAFNDICLKFPATTIITRTDAAPILKTKRISNHFIFMYSKRYPLKKSKFCNDLSQNMHITMNVVSESIKVAMYMGFKNIYLLGCDYSAFAHPVEVHCYEDDKNQKLKRNRLGFLLKFYALTTEIHYLLQKKAKRAGVNIINITPDSLLDAYQMGTITQVLE